MIFIFLATMAQAAPDWGHLLDQQGGQAVHFGMVTEAPPPFARNGEEPFAPASNSKLFTAGIALETLGPDFRYATRLRWMRLSQDTITNLQLVGSGDPSWGLGELGEGLSTRLDTFASALAAAGVRKVQGDPTLLAADPRWDNLQFPAGWKASDTLGCDGALAQAFNLSVNCATYELRSRQTGAWQENGADFPVSLRLVPGKKTSVSVRLDQDGQGHFLFVMEGSWRKGSRPLRFTLPIYDTHAWVANLFRASLKKHGIALLPSTPQTGAWEEREFLSPPLSQILKPFLKNSINFLGDGVLKTLGAHDDRSVQEEGLLDAGLLALRDHLHALGLAVELYDGSGLSRLSRVSPQVLFKFLDHMKDQPSFPALWDALPIAGVDGTLHARMQGTAAQNFLRAKTGTLDGVYNLSGYVPEGNGFVPFVILSRTSSDERFAAREAEDRVGAALAGLFRPKAALPEAVPFPYVPEHAGRDAQ